MVYFNYTVHHAIRNLGEVGYDGIEIWGGRPHMYRNDLDAQIGELQDLLRQYDMEVCNFIPAQYRYPSLLCSDNEVVRKDSVSYIETAMKNARLVGSPSISLCPGMVPWDNDTTAGMRQLRKSFSEIDTINQKYGLLILIEPAHRYETNLILTVEKCVEEIDLLGAARFGVLLDTGHCHLNGENFEEAIGLVGDLPLHIHIDDNLADADSHLLPGEGNIDFEPLIRALRAKQYEGYISGELGAKYITEPEAAVRTNLDWLRVNFA